MAQSCAPWLNSVHSWLNAVHQASIILWLNAVHASGIMAQYTLCMKYPNYSSVLCNRHQCICASCINMARCCASTAQKCISGVNMVYWCVSGINMAQNGSMLCIIYQYGSMLYIHGSMLSCASTVQCCASGIIMAKYGSNLGYASCINMTRCGASMTQAVHHTSIMDQCSMRSH